MIATKRRPSVEPKKRVAKTNPTDEAVPLNKFIAHAGVCSRRAAVELIKDGYVRVNGTVIKEPGHKIAADDAVKVHNKLIARVKSKDYVYIILNKPRGTVTTASDERGRPSVVDLVKLPKKTRLFPVGRLDINTSGVLFLTNDGALAQKLAHPSSQVEKVYEITVHKEIEASDVERIKKGIRLEDGVVQIDGLYLLPTPKKNMVGLTLHSGKNRVVRRVFDALNYFVEKLDRVSCAGITKKGLARGAWRHLTKREVEKLRKIGK
jgi:23S rRNA pseudouridine2605 synthase